VGPFESYPWRTADTFRLRLRSEPKGEAAVLAVPNRTYAASAGFGRFGSQSSALSYRREDLVCPPESDALYTYGPTRASDSLGQSWATEFLFHPKSRIARAA
jgi:hypothetical protein